MITRIQLKVFKEKLTLLFYIFLLLNVTKTYATDFSLPQQWITLKPVLVSRSLQKDLKMKLSQQQVDSFVNFLNNLKMPIPNLINLQNTLPKTTIELLMAIHERGLILEEAEKMADYLHRLANKFQFQNIKAFDENTSHIIGREWQEIDYRGENMTWQKQQQKYLPYGILNFKSLDCLMKFFLVESRLPYFKKIYRPKNPNAAIEFH